MKRIAVLLLGACLLAAGALGARAWSEGAGYELQVVLPSAAGVFEGGLVKIGGRDAGKVTGIDTRSGKALVTVQVDDENAPLHDGTKARVSWNSVIDARVLELIPGPASHAELPSGKLIAGTERVEIDQVLATLDPATLKRVNSLVVRLRDTLEGSEGDLNATLREAGPAVHALGEVLRAVGDDGPAIRDLVTRLEDMTSTLAQRRTKLSATVHDLSTLTNTAAAKQGSLKEGLAELPPTIDEAKRALGKVSPAVDAAKPLLDDLAPAAAKLPRVAKNLSPVLRDLRPTMAELRPTLAAAQSLLGATPGLLDSAHGALPGATRAVEQLQPVAAYLRPYTPELAGWLSNWTSIFSGYGPTGHYARALITGSASSVDDNPGVIPPGLNRSPRPLPGSPEGQPWTDAHGSGMR